MQTSEESATPRIGAAEMLLVEASRIAERRRRQLLWLLLLPAALVLAALVAVAGLPVAAGIVEFAVLVTAVSIVARRSAPIDGVARALDHRLGAKERFVTIATTDHRSGGLRDYVLRETSRLADGASPRRLLPGPSWSTLGAAATGLAVLAIVISVPFLEARVPPSAAALDPLRLRHLEELATTVASSRNPRASRIGERVLEILPVLRDPSVRPEEKRDRTLPIFDVYGQETGSLTGDLDLPGAYGGGEGRGSGKGSGHGDGAGSGELDTGTPLERLMIELERLRGELEGKKGSPSAASRAKGEGSGGGEDSAGDVNESGEHPESAGGGDDATTAIATPEASGPGEGVAAESPEESSRSSSGDDLAAAGIGRAPEGAADRSPNRPAERHHRAGEEPLGWRVAGGRYVRVWVPEGDASREIDRVREAGGILPRTPLGDAPLPSAGPAGAPRASTDVPLEYRDILAPREKTRR